MQTHGLYLVFEGLPRGGKTTQTNLLVNNLKNDFPNREVITAFEPGGTEIANAIRVVVQGTRFREDMDPFCEAYLYAAARSQSLRQVVKPALNRGAIVISDRSFLTSLAFQGGGRSLGYRTVMGINKYAVGGITPDHIFFFNRPPEVTIGLRPPDGDDKFEDFDKDFFVKARRAYLALGKKWGRTWTVIDAAQSVEEIQTKIYAVVVKLLGRPQLFK